MYNKLFGLILSCFLSSSVCHGDTILAYRVMDQYGPCFCKAEVTITKLSASEPRRTLVHKGNWSGTFTVPDGSVLEFKVNGVLAKRMILSPDGNPFMIELKLPISKK